MALTKEKKKQIVKKIEENIDSQKIMVFIGIAKMKTKDLFGLKKELKEKGNVLSVVKKTLLNIASKNKDIPVDAKKLEGEIAVVFGKEDEVSAAKIIHKFSKVNEGLRILGGLLENKAIEKEEVIALAQLPSKPELLAKAVRSIKAPITNFVNVLGGNLRGLVYVLSQIKNIKS